MLGKQASLLAQELFRIDVRLFQNRAQRPFRHVSGMIGNRRVPVCLRIEPDFVAALQPGGRIRSRIV